tara:strand:- start:196 stop:360 length:165 start_codon:yes stop_codon:yes gene_type:complete
LLKRAQKEWDSNPDNAINENTLSERYFILIISAMEVKIGNVKDNKIIDLWNTEY